VSAEGQKPLFGESNVAIRLIREPWRRLGFIHPRVVIFRIRIHRRTS
jgi:hypothetical protein